MLSTTSFKNLNTIQNKAIKIIKRKSIYSSLSEINTSIESLTDRFNELNKRYLIKAITNNNEIILELWNDYKEFSLSREIKQPTILCNYKSCLTS